jgi:hypothetical protein
MYTDFVVLTEMWRDHQYEEIGILLENEDWPRGRLVQFCSYFVRHMGIDELKVLHLFV